MKRKLIFWLILSVTIMLLLPWIAVTFVKGDEGMAAWFILFFCVNPIYSIAAGVFAGKDRKCLWHLPFVSAALFLSGTWIFFDMGEMAFVLYALIYLILGIVAMLISIFINKKIKHHSHI